MKNKDKKDINDINDINDDTTVVSSCANACEEEEYTGFDPENRKPSVLKKIFKISAVAIILCVYAVLFVRFFVSCDSDIVDDILETEEIIAAYENYPEEFEIQEYGITHWYESKSAAGDDSGFGGKILAISDLYYIPMTQSLQFSIKFNKDILVNKEQEYSAECLPFSCYLVDGDGNKYENIVAVKYDERYSYGYIRLCFDGVSLEKEGLYDEEGTALRNSFELRMFMYEGDGKYSDENYQSFSLYTGNPHYKPLEYEREN